MKKIKIMLLSLLVILLTLNVHAQSAASCKDFAKEGFSVLDTTVYTHDARYNALKISQGDKIDVYKPFYKGRTYKIVVSSEEILQGMTFKVVNIQKVTLYESKNIENIQTWEFTPEKNENLIITVEIPGPKEAEAEPQSGCVAVIVGYKVE